MFMKRDRNDKIRKLSILCRLSFTPTANEYIRPTSTRWTPWSPPQLQMVVFVCGLRGRLKQHSPEPWFSGWGGGGRHIPRFLFCEWRYWPLMLFNVVVVQFNVVLG